MNTIFSTALRIAGAFCLAISILPARASAQAAGAGMGGMGAMQQVRQVIAQLDLSADQKTKIQGIVRQAMQDARDAMQGMQDLSPQERQAKMQDLKKLVADSMDKVQAELTDDQKAKFYPLLAKAGLKQMTDLVAGLKKAESSQKMSDDITKQLNDVLDDSGKTLDGFKADADAVNDADGAKDFQQKLVRFQLDLRKQVVGILGQDDGPKLMQAARQSMRPGQGGAPKVEAAPTTAPAAK